jgi:1-acyl-sn-glycerol-3-phosphate acyltransferase
MDRTDLPDPATGIIPFFYNSPKGRKGTSLLDRIFKCVISISIILFVVLFGFVLNLVQLITVPLMLFSHSFVIRLHSQFAGWLWGLFQIMFERYQRANLTWSGGVSFIPTRENAVVISNHCSFADFFLVHSLAYPKGMLPYCKYFVKVPSISINFFFLFHFFSFIYLFTC